MFDAATRLQCSGLRGSLKHEPEDVPTVEPRPHHDDTWRLMEQIHEPTPPAGSGTSRRPFSSLREFVS
ncbi:hypothetical protein CgunFtcFv8_012275 [Champsocephalus gunnari]|uniref:Uncharacterized protein n=1 Tax=Champsocephalus gunnari TaxID=52237 RepID=A0AAN8D671_CHAGU|nr:hypothetical protein CgunFtcFv8_012275 [Champsocephalus gunnari]